MKAIAMPKVFKFGLNEQVSISTSGELGTVRARAEWLTGNTSYMVAYKQASGCHREEWIDEDLLMPAPF